MNRRSFLGLPLGAAAAVVMPSLPVEAKSLFQGGYSTGGKLIGGIATQGTLAAPALERARFDASLQILLDELNKARDRGEFDRKA